VHEPAHSGPRKIIVVRAVLQPSPPRQWGKPVRGAILVNMLEQPLRELLFFSRPLCLRASGCCYRSPLANCNSWQTCTCSELQQEQEGNQRAVYLSHTNIL